MKPLVFEYFRTNFSNESRLLFGNGFRMSSVASLAVLLILVSGCANWNGSNETSSRSSFNLANSRMSPGSVGIEIAVAQLDANQMPQLDQLMGTLDQQKFPLEVRQKLDRNGLTCGIMSTRPPAVLHELLEPYMPDPESLDIAARPLALAGLLDPVSRMLLQQRISNQNGEVYPVGTSDIYEQMEWVLHHSDQQVPGDASVARCFFDITTFANSDGSVTLKLAPVIRHGSEIPRIGVADGSFVMDRRQRQVNLDEVAFKIQLRPGQTLVVVANDPFRDHQTAQNRLGPLLLGSEQPDETRLLLVRLVQTQMDDLFDYTVQ